MLLILILIFPPFGCSTLPRRDLVPFRFCFIYSIRIWKMSRFASILPFALELGACREDKEYFLYLPIVSASSSKMTRCSELLRELDTYDDAGEGDLVGESASLWLAFLKMRCWRYDAARRWALGFAISLKISDVNKGGGSHDSA